MTHKLIINSLAALFLLAGCHKPGDTSNTGNHAVEKKQITSLEGEWELRVIYGGMLPQGSGPNLQPGTGNRWKFTADTYQMIPKDGPVTTGTYSRLKDSSLQTNRMMDAILLKDAGNAIVHYEFNIDTLILYSGMIAADGTIQKYVPVNRVQ
ncbi:hypothetical protein SAMN05444008_107152 [Cnuella takakiae]|uniref:Lipocalin-like domain-containing protein n=1 Tax=Cnuella takakiae TaxID=1302690 RepID=A0A1M5B5G2_9BACT|nr:hypothetical protein [Cnuella takakiae]OLY93348.1 hypothetical protein BUE76_16740 [Cnuella takakiae]SHF37801.1 hypothetical protein SAMN05444008_107152 [Cnuella takakiae]